MALYTKKCAHCGEAFQSTVPHAKFCSPSHRSLSWLQKRNEEDRPGPIVESEKVKTSDSVLPPRITKQEFSLLLHESKEDERVREILSAYPDLIIEIENLQKENDEFRQERKDERARWLADPEGQAARRLRYFKHKRNDKPTEEPEEVEEEETPVKQPEPESLTYARRTFLSRLTGAPANEKVVVKPTDKIRIRQLEKDGFSLIDDRLVDVKFDVKTNVK